MNREISSADDIIDSRDVIARIDELESERDEFLEEWMEAREVEATDDSPWADENPTEADELTALKALADEAEGSPDWVHGEALINEDYFEQYAYDLACDIGAIDKDANWPIMHIDWTAAADALKVDYFSVEFEDSTFWIRS